MTKIKVIKEGSSFPVWLIGIYGTIAIVLTILTKIGVIQWTWEFPWG